MSNNEKVKLLQALSMYNNYFGIEMPTEKKFYAKEITTGMYSQETKIQRAKEKEERRRLKRERLKNKH